MSQPTSTRALMAPFATAIFAKAEALRTLDLKAAHRSRLSESISDDIKKASNFHPHRMSKRARQKARGFAAPVDLTEMTWHQQESFDPGRELFIVEHRATVSSLKQRCLNAANVEGVLDILEEEIDVVWILREEDEELTRLKYRSKRPASAYEEAQIQIWDGE
ncbi:MAG TPA: hypothetical protein VJN18_00780 [Polyangiaceae bacterium]|nr:hypothetical protein [Polyangiaceae bacterium]